MPSIDLIKVLDLLARTHDHEVRVVFANGELSVKFRKGKEIDPELLNELRANKDGLIEYFGYYKNEFSDDEGQGSGHLIQLAEGSGAPPLFIIPGTGGKSGGYQILSDCLAGEYSVYGLEMLGTQKGETPLKTIQEIAAQNIRWIRQVQPKGPYRFMGHSLGAYIMYEMTRQLEAMGEIPDFIAVLDQTITRLTGLPFHIGKAEFVMKMTKDYFESFKILSPPFPSWMEEMKNSLKKLSLEEMAPFIAGLAGRKLPHAAKVIDYVIRLVNIRVHNETLVYRPSGRIHAEVLVFKAADNLVEYPEETLHWSTYAGKVKVFVVPGNHHFMLLEDNPIAIARFLKQRMQR